MARTVVGIFPDRISVEHAIVDLKAAGFDPQRMGIVMRDRSDAREVANDQGVSSAVGAVTGGVLGGTAGALLAATGALAIPGIGPFIAGGVLASLVGGAAGWLVGGLVGLGLSHDEAEYYQNRVEQGGILLTVDPEGRDEEARRIMFDNSAQDMQSQGGGRSAGDSRDKEWQVSSGWSPALTDEQEAMGYHATRPTMPRRPAMDEDILQGRTHGTVGDKDVVTNRDDQGDEVSRLSAEGERDQQMLDEQSGSGTY